MTLNGRIVLAYMRPWVPFLALDGKQKHPGETPTDSYILLRQDGLCMARTRGTSVPAAVVISFCLGGRQSSEGSISHDWVGPLPEHAGSSNENSMSHGPKEIPAAKAGQGGIRL